MPQRVHGSVYGIKVGRRHHNFYHRAVNPFIIPLSKLISAQSLFFGLPQR